MPILEARAVSKAYGGFLALDNVNLTVEPGEIRALIGPNGAGKSTLIDVLSGRARGHAGQVFFQDAEITPLAPWARRLKGLARSFQKTSIFPALSVRAQLELAARKAEAGGDVGETLAEFGLEGVAERPAGAIGYGDQRRLDLALALTGRPSLLLLDEPAAGLSFEESMKLAKALREMANRRGVTVLLVEHDMEVVFAIADTITVLQLGKVLAEGPPAQVRADPRVVQAYLGSAA
ncbi:MAG: ABC transporter ATP-binding protein [Rhodospirillales bacterium]|nr:ABC transporter ATP-binding protein [Rhodospirillales bacterium]